MKKVRRIIEEEDDDDIHTSVEKTLSNKRSPVNQRKLRRRMIFEEEDDIHTSVEKTLSNNTISNKRSPVNQRKLHRRMIFEEDDDDNLETLFSKLEVSHPSKSDKRLLNRDSLKSSCYRSFSANKDFIIKKFTENVKGKKICIVGQNTKHDGKEGHWLETQMGIVHNSHNEPDIRGYEMKKSSKKITLGDFSASEYAFSTRGKRVYINTYNNWTDELKISRSNFIFYFGNPNINKGSRYSWSGKSVPKYNEWNYNGQILLITDNKDIVIYYSFTKDKRPRKIDFPNFLRKDDVLIAVWKREKMEPHINKKFNVKGFFMCKKIDEKFEKICFGKAFDFEYFISSIKNKTIIFDSGMTDGNTRNYSHFRGTNFWNNLIIEEY